MPPASQLKIDLPLANNDANGRSICTFGSLAVLISLVLRLALILDP